MSELSHPQSSHPSCCGQHSPSSSVTVGSLLSPEGIHCCPDLLIHMAPWFLGHVGTVQWHFWRSWMVLWGSLGTWGQCSDISGGAGCLWVPGQCPVLGEAACRARLGVTGGDPLSQGQDRPAEEALGLLSTALPSLRFQQPPELCWIPENQQCWENCAVWEGEPRWLGSVLFIQEVLPVRNPCADPTLGVLG